MARGPPGPISPGVRMVVLMSDPSVAAVPVRECGEPLRSVRCSSTSASVGTREAPSSTSGRGARSAASRFVSPPEVAPHSAGAALDVTLADRHGRELDLGTRVNATPEESEGGCYTAAPNIPAAARSLREVLGAALAGAGLVDYPTEWWHWSYGDRYWALMTGAPAAH
ncbi:dipeptidase [Streptomyces profundus]|nr:dipeptidase [Streptomyces sp. MA3_2.13]